MASIDSLCDGKARCEYDITSFGPEIERYKMSNLVNIHRYDRNGSYYFYYQDNISSTIALIDLGIDPNIVDRDGWTPLFMAIYTHHYDSIELLLSVGADTNARDKEMRYPLCLAADIKDQKTVEMLLSRKDTIVNANFFKNIMISDFDLGMLEKIAARFLLSNTEKIVSWDEMEDLPIFLYDQTDHDRSIKVFALFVTVFPGLRTEQNEQCTGKNFIGQLEDFFTFDRVPKFYQREVFDVLNHARFPKLSDVAKLCMVDKAYFQ